MGRGADMIEANMIERARKSLRALTRAIRGLLDLLKAYEANRSVRPSVDVILESLRSCIVATTQALSEVAALDDPSAHGNTRNKFRDFISRNEGSRHRLGLLLRAAEAYCAFRRLRPPVPIDRDQCGAGACSAVGC